MSVFSFITKPFRYSVQQDPAIRTSYDLARQVELNTGVTSVVDAAAVAIELFDILKSPRQRFDVPVVGVDLINLSMFDGLPPCALLMSDRWIKSPSGPELVVNGTCNSTAGWTQIGGVVSSVSGRLRVANFGGKAVQDVPTVIGKTYVFTYERYHLAALGYVLLGFDGEHLADGGSNVKGRVTFVANRVNTTITLTVDSGAGGYSEYDNLSLKELRNEKLVVIPDFTIDLAAGQTILRCWG